MKKIKFFGLVVAIFMAISANAQLDYGLKFGLNYNFSGGDILSKPSEVTEILKGDNNRTGYHLGAFMRLKIPLIGIYVQPELLYNRMNTSYVQKMASGTEENFNISVNRLNIPVLFGKKMLGFAHIHAGPVFSFNLSDKISLADANNLSTDKMTVGVHVGIGIGLGPIILDARYEGSLNKTVTEYLLSGSVDEMVKLDNKPSMVLLSAAYKF